MGAVQPEQRGSASALIASTVGLGLSLGMAWTGTVYSVRKVFHQAALTGQGMEAGLAAHTSIYLAFHDVIIISTVIQFLVLFITLIPKTMAGRE